MDTHVHLESSHLPPERYAEIVLTRHHRGVLGSA